MRKTDSEKPVQRVAYVVANEDLSSALITRQVVELLREEVVQSGGSISIKILLFQTLSSLLSRRKSLRALKSEMRLHGLTLSVLPNLMPWPFPNLRFERTALGLRPSGVWNRFAARAFSLYALPFLIYSYVVDKRRIFHSRSYPPAAAVCVLKKLIPNVKHIFDPRSDFPEENVVAGRWSERSRDFSYWKKKERTLLLHSDLTVCISSVYTDHFKKSLDSFPYILAPNNVNMSTFRYDASARQEIRRRCGWGDDDTVFVYLGNMWADGWHQPRFYRAFIDRVRAWLPRAKLLMLIPAHANQITSEEFSGMAGVHVHNPRYDSVPAYLSAADAGLMYMHRRRLAVGTKLGEYLAIGLPMICNSNCLGSCGFLVEHREAGQVFDIGLGDLDRVARDFNSEQLLQHKASRDELRSIAKSKFSNEHVARCYIRAYRDLSLREPGRK